MAKISIALLRAEFKGWEEMGKSLNAANGKNIPFGKYMIDKYSFIEKDLETETDTNKSMLILLKNHVQEIT